MSSTQPLKTSPNDSEDRVQYLRTPILSGHDVEAKRQEIADYFNATWHRYDALF